jgi:regulator of protease activity HflC (stomatin/prohibitin superfamily)
MRDTFDPRDITRRPGQMGLPKWAGPVAIAILVAVVASTAVVQIPAGHVGVVTLFGSVSERALESGLHLVNPLARVIRMDIRTNEVKEVAQVPSKEGLSVGTEISVLFRLENAP